MKGLVSVIVPVYNVKDMLDKCVRSLVNQTYEHIEIILVDDGSTDESGVKCDTWQKKDDRIKVIHKINGGLSSARNAGMQIAKGEYIQFVDSDDWVDIKLIEDLLNAAVKSKSDIAMCGIKTTDTIKEIKLSWFDEETVFDSERALKYLLENTKITSHAWNKLYKKDLIERFPFPEGKLYEDIFIMHNVFRNAHQIIVIPKYYYYYYQRSNSITTVVSMKNKLAYVEAFAKRYDDLKNIYPQYKDFLLSQIAVSLSLMIVQNRYENGELRLYKLELKEIKTVLNKKEIEKVVRTYATKSQIIYYYLARTFFLKAYGIYRCFFYFTSGNKIWFREKLIY